MAHIDLDTLIKLTQQSCNSLISLLEKENKTLLKGDTLQLEQLSEKKLVQLTQLNEHQTQLKLFFDNSSENNTPSSTTENHYSQATQNKWARLLSLFEKCQQLNNRNGYIINASLKNTASSLAVLSGQKLNDAPIYTINGYNEADITSRIIAKI